MRSFLLVPAALLTAMVSATAASGQSSVPAFNTIRTPTSPAFVLLGVEPSSVERPTTPADFAASIVNATDNFSSLPKNFALEASPYWLVGHPGQDWRADVKRTVLQSAQRTFTLAAATAQTGTEAAAVTGLAVSGRVSLLSGHLTASTIQQLARIDSLAAVEQGELLRRLLKAGLPAADKLLGFAAQADAGEATANNDTIIKGLTALTEGGNAGAIGAAKNVLKAQVALARRIATSDEDRSAVDAAEAQLASSLSKEPDEISEADGPAAKALVAARQQFASAREGVVVEFAGGASWSAPNAVIDSVALSRWGAWLTVGYELPKVSFVGVLRYLDSGTSMADDAVDVGGRVAISQDLYAISVEYVDRHFIHGADVPRPWRLAGMFDYKVSSTLWLTGSFGRDYESTKAGSLLARLGASVQLSKDRYQAASP